MATHKKSPVFIRIKTSQKEVVCVNPLQLSSFRIVEKYDVKNKDGQVIGTGDTLFFYLPAGTYTRYTVGMEITQDEFNYVSNTLTEYLYMNAYEFQARSERLDAERLAEWNDKMASPEVDAVEEPVK